VLVQSMTGAHLQKCLCSGLKALVYVWVAAHLWKIWLSVLFLCPSFLVEVSENILVFLKNIIGTLRMNELSAACLIMFFAFQLWKQLRPETSCLKWWLLLHYSWESYTCIKL